MMKAMMGLGYRYGFFPTQQQAAFSMLTLDRGRAGPLGAALQLEADEVGPHSFIHSFVTKSTVLRQAYSITTLLSCGPSAALACLLGFRTRPEVLR